MDYSLLYLRRERAYSLLYLRRERARRRAQRAGRAGNGRITRCVDDDLFMVEALENDGLVHEAPAIVRRQSTSALAHATA